MSQIASTTWGQIDIETKMALGRGYKSTETKVDGIDCDNLSRVIEDMAKSK